LYRKMQGLSCFWGYFVCLALTCLVLLAFLFFVLLVFLGSADF
jgi:hypothetical protein